MNQFDRVFVNAFFDQLHNGLLVAHKTYIFMRYLDILAQNLQLIRLFLQQVLKVSDLRLCFGKRVALLTDELVQHLDFTGILDVLIPPQPLYRSRVLRKITVVHVLMIP